MGDITEMAGSMTPEASANPKVLALTGGVGGAKLALGLTKILDGASLTLVANTGDDFEHLGLCISPDLDTVMYTLSGRAHPQTGWGRHPESWHFLSALEELGGETWFRLGDRDLATHVVRTRALSRGETLSQVTRDLCRRLGVAHPLFPMSDDPVRTVVLTPEGPLTFQDYFVRRGCRPRVEGFRFQGVEAARPSPGFQAILDDPDLDVVILCPSNPFISLDPILALPGVRRALEASPARVVAVSPLVGGKALKGPTAKMFMELGLPSSPLAVARHYLAPGPLLDAFLIDPADACEKPGIEALGLVCPVVPAVMETLEDKVSLARQALRAASACK